MMSKILAVKLGDKLEFKDENGNVVLLQDGQTVVLPNGQELIVQRVNGRYELIDILGDKIDVQSGEEISLVNSQNQENIVSNTTATSLQEDISLTDNSQNSTDTTIHSYDVSKSKPLHANTTSENLQPRQMERTADVKNVEADVEDFDKSEQKSDDERTFGEPEGKPTATFPDVFLQMHSNKDSIEEGEDVTYTLTLVDEYGQEVIVPDGKVLKISLSWSGEGANGIDMANLPQEVAMSNGSSTTFTVSSSHDVYKESNESLELGIQDVSIPKRTFHSVTPIGEKPHLDIADKPSSEEVELHLSEVGSAKEGIGASYELSVENPVATDLKVPIVYTYTTAASNDIVSEVKNVTIKAGEKSASFHIDINNDGVYEGDESFSVKLGTPQGDGGFYNLKTDTTAIDTTITDAQSPVSVTNITALDATEGEDVTFNIDLSSTSKADTKVQISLQNSDGSVNSNIKTDEISYSLDGGGTWKHASVTNGTFTATVKDQTKLLVKIPTSDDDVYEVKKEISLSAKTQYQQDSISKAVSLKDEDSDNDGVLDDIPKVSVSADKTDFAEGDDTYATFTLTKTGESKVDGSVKVTLSTNAQEEDFTSNLQYQDKNGSWRDLPTNGVVNIAAAQSEVKLRIGIKDDYLKEENENITLNISDAKDLSIDEKSATTNIQDESSGDSVYLQIDGNSAIIEEDGAKLTHTIKLTDENGNVVILGKDESITVSLKYSPDTTNGDDFSQKLTTFTLKGDGQSSSFSFSNVLKGDLVNEGTESYTLSIGGVTSDSGYFEKIEIKPSSVTGTIYDAPTIDLDTTTNGDDYKAEFTENIAISVADKVSISDSPNLQKLVVTLTNPQADDKLDTSKVNVALFAIDASDDKVTLTPQNGKHPNYTDFQTALKAIQFTNASDNPSTVQRDITISISDETLTSNVAHTKLDIDLAPDAKGSTESVTENSDGGNTSIGGNLISDDDQGSGNASIDQIKYHDINGDEKTATITGETTLTTQYGKLTIDTNGQYTYTPNANLTHPANGADLVETYKYSIKDSDGDKSEFATQTINVKDGASPQIADRTNSVDEANLPLGSTPQNGQLSKSGTLGVVKGSDDFTVSFDSVQSDLEDLGLSSGGVKLVYTIENESIVAKKGSEEIFKVILTDTHENAGYKFTLSGSIDHQDSQTIKEIPFKIKVTDDDDKDSDSATLTVSVKDDVVDPSVEILKSVDEDSVTNYFTTNADATAGNTTISGTSLGGGWMKTDHGKAKVADDGRIIYEPDENYSGEDTINYNTSVDGNTKKDFTIKVEVKPVADDPKMPDDVTVKTYEDANAIDAKVSDANQREGSNDKPLGLTLPKLADQTDQADQNSSEARDNPERFGALVFTFSSAVDFGTATIKYDSNRDGTLDATLTTVQKGDAFSVDITDVDNYHPAGTSGKYHLTEAQYKSLAITHDEDNAKNITFTIGTKMHEVDDSGKSLVASNEVKQSVTLDVQAATDEVSITLNAKKPDKAEALKVTSDTITITSDEDTPINLKNVIQEHFKDTDGSEKFHYEFTGLPEGMKITIAGKTYTAGSGGSITSDEVVITKSTDPDIIITPPKNFSGDLKDISMKLVTKDYDSDSVDGNGERQETASAFNFVVHVKPIADDIKNMGTKSVDEDESVEAFKDFDLTDDSEHVTKVVFSGLENGTTVKYNGVETKITDGTFTIGDGTTDLVISKIQAITVTPPKNSSKDMTIMATATVKDTAMVDGNEETSVIDQTSEFKLTVHPVAESDASVTAGHTFDAANTGTEDKFFNIGKDSTYTLKDQLVSSDNTESIYAHLTFGVGSGTSFDPMAGATFQYLDGSKTITLKDSGSGVDVPKEYLDSLTVKPPQDKSGNFRIKVQIHNVDIDEDSSDNTKDENTSSDAQFLDFAVAGQADKVLVSVKPTSGLEDAGRSKGNSSNVASEASEIDEPQNGINIDVNVTSTDKDNITFGSESYNVKIGGIPNGASMYVYDGSKYILVNKDTTSSGNISIETSSNSWTITITDYKNDKPSKIIPPHNSDVDINLSISAQAKDGSDTTEFSDPLTTTVQVTAVADVTKDYTLKTPTAQEDSDTEGGASVSINELIDGSVFSSYDDDNSETVSFKITNLDPKFSMQGASYLGNNAWAITQSAFNDGTAKIVAPADFSGKIDFKIDAITTENAGNSKKYNEIGGDNMSIVITPQADGVLENLNAKTNEDEEVVLTFKYESKDTSKDGGSGESLEAIYIKISDLKAHASAVKINGVIVSDLDSANSSEHSGYLKISPTDKFSLTPKENVGEEFALGVKYDVKDTSANGDSVTATKDATYNVEVTPVTDTPTASLDSDETVTLSNANKSFTKTFTLTSDDTDGSESFTRVEVEGVPKGVEVEGGVYVESSNTWYVDIDNMKITEGGQSYTLTFKAGGKAISSSDEVTIKGFTQDGSEASEASASAKFTLKTNIISSGDDGTGNEPADITSLSMQAPTSDEDSAFSLGDFAKGTLSHTNGSISIKISSLPEGASVSGATKVRDEVGDVWIASSKNGADALQNLLNSIKIQAPENTNGDMSFSVEVTTYGVNGDSKHKTLNGTAHITPVTDEMDFDGKTVDLGSMDEDTTKEISLNMTNSSDKNTTIVDGKVYVQLSGGEAKDGVISYSGEEITKTSVSGVGGLSDGEYYVLEYKKDEKIKFTPKENEDGEVTFDLYIQNQQKGASNTTLSHGTYTLTVKPVADDISLEVKDSSGDEDSYIALDVTASIPDSSESIKTFTINNVPNDYLVYVGTEGSKTQATNLGDNTWSVNADGLTGENPTKHIYIKPPENVATTIEKPIKDLTIVAISDTGTTQTSEKFNVTVTPKADSISISPTDSMGEEYKWIDLNLNASLEDRDGSETVKLTLSGLDESASFRLSDGTVLSATYENGIYTINDISSEHINDVQILYHEYSGDINVTVTTKDGDDVNTTSATGTVSVDISSNPDIEGTSGDDTIKVVSGGKNVTAKGGDDHITLATNEENISIDARSGDDTITLSTDVSKTTTILGGSGSDTLALDNGIDMDFSALKATIGGIEKIDLKSDSGKNEVTFDLDSIKGILSSSGDGSDANGILEIKGGGSGNDQDVVNLKGGDKWTSTDNSDGTHTWTNSDTPAITLKIDDDINIHLIN